MRYFVTDAKKNLAFNNAYGAGASCSVPIGNLVPCADFVSGALIVRVDSVTLATSGGAPSFSILAFPVSTSPTAENTPYGFGGVSPLATIPPITGTSASPVAYVQPLSGFIPDHIQVFVVYVCPTAAGSSNITLEVELDLRTR